VIVDRLTGEVRSAQIFVAVMGASNLNPNPFIEPARSISLNTTSTGTLVFCKIAMASSVLAASTA
jgi:transposase